MAEHEPQPSFEQLEERGRKLAEHLNSLAPHEYSPEEPKLKEIIDNLDGNIDTQ
jgi:hypothetical protein